MDLQQLGNTDIKIPPIVFGGNVFGWTINEKESFRMLDDASSYSLKETCKTRRLSRVLQ